MPDLTEEEYDALDEKIEKAIGTIISFFMMDYLVTHLS